MIAGKPIGRAVLIGDLLADKYLVAAGYVPRRGIGGLGALAPPLAPPPERLLPEAC